MIDLLVEHGANPHRRRSDGCTAHTLAELHGNHDIASKAGHRLARRTSSRRSNGSSRRARAEMVPPQPRCSTPAGPPSRAANRASPVMHRPAETGNARAGDDALLWFRCQMLRDKDDVAPIHRAAMADIPRRRACCSHSAPTSTSSTGRSAATPLVWAVEGRGHAAPGADHVGVARVLIAAGSTLEWQPPADAPDQERTCEGLNQACCVLVTSTGHQLGSSVALKSCPTPYSESEESMPADADCQGLVSFSY